MKRKEITKANSFLYDVDFFSGWLEIMDGKKSCHYHSSGPMLSMSLSSIEVTGFNSLQSEYMGCKRTSVVE